MATEAGARPVRQGWIFEQLSQPPLSPMEGRPRTQASANFSNYGDSLSLQGSALLDFRDLEIGVKGSQRFFLALGPDGSAEKAALFPERNTLGFQIARSFSTPERQYGRLGLEAVLFLPTLRQWLRFSLDSGILATESLPWSFELHTSFFLRVGPRESNALVIGAQTMRVFSLTPRQKIEIGMQFAWDYMMIDPSDVQGLYEHMLFSFGPAISYDGGFGVLRLFVPTRLYLDLEAIGTPHVTQTGYPSEWPALPDVSLTWTVLI